MGFDRSPMIVAIRVRPLLPHEEQQPPPAAGNPVSCVSVDVQRAVVSVEERRLAVDLRPYVEVRGVFPMDYAFDASSKNIHVYMSTTRPQLLDAVNNNGRLAVFAFGQTGSGKTHTMLGSNAEHGLYALAVRDLLQYGVHPKGLDLNFSFYEIYGGKTFDLLNDRNEIKALEDDKQVVHLKGLSEFPIDDEDTFLELLHRGSQHRSSGSTHVNDRSSRSHAVALLNLTKKTSKGVVKVMSKYTFIDLAGSERGRDTLDTQKATQQEGADINRSLLAVKECVRALHMGHTHVPFRGSKLTQVLRESLSGRCSTVMMAMVSPYYKHVEDTVNALKYTAMIREVGSPQTCNMPLSPPTGTGRGGFSSFDNAANDTGSDSTRTPPPNNLLSSLDTMNVETCAKCGYPLYDDGTPHRCPKASVLCSNCGISVPKRGLEQHLIDCPDVEVNCEFCDAAMKRHLLKHHEQNCPESFAICTQCRAKIHPRKMLQEHMDERCPNAKWMCPYCRIVTAKKNADDHQSNCMARLTTCDSCGFRVRLGHLKQHKRVCLGVGKIDEIIDQQVVSPKGPPHMLQPIERGTGGDISTTTNANSKSPIGGLNIKNNANSKIAASPASPASLAAAAPPTSGRTGAGGISKPPTLAHLRIPTVPEITKLIVPSSEPQQQPQQTGGIKKQKSPTNQQSPQQQQQQQHQRSKSDNVSTTATASAKKATTGAATARTAASPASNGGGASQSPGSTSSPPGFSATARPSQSSSNRSPKQEFPPLVSKASPQPQQQQRQQPTTARTAATTTSRASPSPPRVAAQQQRTQQQQQRQTAGTNKISGSPRRTTTPTKTATANRSSIPSTTSPASQQKQEQQHHHHPPPSLSPMPVATCQFCRGHFLESVLSQHIENDCMAVQVPCPFKDAGCSHLVTRRQLAQHLNDNVGSHLVMLHTKTQNVEQENVQLKMRLMELEETSKTTTTTGATAAAAAAAGVMAGNPSSRTHSRTSSSSDFVSRAILAARERRDSSAGAAAVAPSSSSSTAGTRQGQQQSTTTAAQFKASKQVMRVSPPSSYSPQPPPPPQPDPALTASRNLTQEFASTRDDGDDDGGYNTENERDEASLNLNSRTAFVPKTQNHSSPRAAAAAGASALESQSQPSTAATTGRDGRTSTAAGENNNNSSMRDPTPPMTISQLMTSNHHHHHDDDDDQSSSSPHGSFNAGRRSRSPSSPPSNNNARAAPHHHHHHHHHPNPSQQHLQMRDEEVVSIDDDTLPADRINNYNTTDHESQEERFTPRSNYNASSAGGSSTNNGRANVGWSNMQPTPTLVRRGSSRTTSELVRLPPEPGADNRNNQQSNNRSSPPSIETNPRSRNDGATASINNSNKSSSPLQLGQVKVPSPPSQLRPTMKAGDASSRSEASSFALSRSGASLNAGSSKKNTSPRPVEHGRWKG